MVVSQTEKNASRIITRIPFLYQGLIETKKRLLLLKIIREFVTNFDISRRRKRVKISKKEKKSNIEPASVPFYFSNENSMHTFHNDQTYRRPIRGRGGTRASNNYIIF